VLPRVSAAAAAAAAGGGKSNGKEGEPFCRTFSETTNVMFADLSSDLIDAYIHTGEGGFGGG
jgi:predicted house-cleaning NTP pyrophosphatase (Maf/HAM1 superfamily)